MTKHLEQIKQPEKGKVRRFLSACSRPFDLVRQNKAGPSAGRRNKTLQKITKLYTTLRSTAFSRVRQGAGSWSWWPSGGTFGAFWGFSLIGPRQAGGQGSCQGCPQSPQSRFCISKGWGIPTIAIFMSIILDNSGAIVSWFFLQANHHDVSAHKNIGHHS